LTSILITQCLQNDFVKLIGKYEPLPNLLHIGHNEALRLVGEDLESSPLNQVLGWAYQQPTEKLELIHVRDWHDEADHGQKDHLNHFGAHCLKDSPGAEFIFQIPKDSSQRSVKIVNSPGLNDFEGTSLHDYLSPYNRPKVKLGIVGVWTEAKITYLAYEIRTRYPHIQVAICSALVASSTRSQHYASLGQLEKILGVRIIDSVAEFVSFLGDQDFKLSRPVKNKPTVELEGTPVLPFKKETLELIEYLFRDCLEVKLKILDGGFSGNFVLGCESTDMNGRQQVPHVLKIGKRELIAKERTSFEQVEQLLGNSAPRVVDFADAIFQGAIKYRYASMGEGNSASFQKSFMKGLGLREVSRILDQVFSHQLGRLYMAAQMESCNLFDYYGFRAEMASSVRASVNSHLIEAAEGNTISFFGKKNIQNPASFYEQFLPLVKSTQEQRYFSYVHGDLNAANIILDAHKNVWLIDFFTLTKGMS
jgi:nicotinamidase-related amidase